MADPEVLIITVLTLAATAAGVRALRLPGGTERARWSFIAGALFGGLFCFAALWNLIGIHTAHHVSATGVVQDLESQGGTPSSSYFTVVPAAGEPLKVHSDYAGAHLHNGETVLVDELSFHSTLLRLRVLDGRDTGWSLEEGDGTRTSALVLFLGIAVVAGAWNRRASDPED